MFGCPFGFFFFFFSTDFKLALAYTLHTQLALRWAPPLFSSFEGSFACRWGDDGRAGGSTGP